MILFLLLPVGMIRGNDDEVELPKNIVWRKDKAEMVLILAGSFEMGNHWLDTANLRDAQPIHSVQLDVFYMDTHEVTVEQHKKFIQQTGFNPYLIGAGQVSAAAFWKYINLVSSTDNHPMTMVSWHDAMMYAQWAGKRLPTEAEWEYAARGGLGEQRYLWGNSKPDGSQCNLADQKVKELVETSSIEETHIMAELDLDEGYATAAPVKSFPPNGYGLYDMSGNVAEWYLDAYQKKIYSYSPTKNPIAQYMDIESLLRSFQAVHTKRVVRGGGWGSIGESLRVDHRMSFEPDGVELFLGFRCVKAIDKVANKSSIP